jgi:Tfp pilus assembly protein PilW
VAPARLKEEAGFTLVEELVACVVGIVVILAISSMMDIVPTLTARVQDRVDSAARARVAMEQMARELRAQVCIGPSTPAIVSAQNNSVTFYAFTGIGAYAPQMHTIAWDPASNRITDAAYAGTGSPPAMTFASSPTQVSTLLTNVVPENGAPLFTYYAYSTTPPVAPTVQQATPVSGSATAGIARIAIKFVARPASNPTSAQSTTLEDDVYVRTWNPDAANGPATPPCV